MRRWIACCAIVMLTCLCARGAQDSPWRPATQAELAALLPPRAPVIQERIETEMRTASGITDGKGRYVAGVVLITAGYSADGKYSHFFLSQVPLHVGSLKLPAGSYVFGYEHKDDALLVKFYEALTGRQVGEVEATLNPAITRVESFRIWPPDDRSVIQIGRFTFSYQLGS